MTFRITISTPDILMSTKSLLLHQLVFSSGPFSGANVPTLRKDTSSCYDPGSFQLHLQTQRQPLHLMFWMTSVLMH